MDEAEPDTDITLAEQIPTMVDDVDGAVAYKAQHDRAGEALRSRYAKKSPALASAPATRHVDAFTDLGDNYQSAGRRLRGEDHRTSVEDVFQRELKVARARLECR